MRKTISLNVALVLGGLTLFIMFIFAQATDAPPIRPPDGPGAPVFTVAGAKPGDTALRVASGANAPVDVEGDFLIGPDYVPAPELQVVAGVPQGTVRQFTMDSVDSRFTPASAAPHSARWILPTPGP